jgi:hypothetical protein
MNPEIEAAKAIRGWRIVQTRISSPNRWQKRIMMIEEARE